MSQEYVIRHSAPTLAGLKTGSLFPCRFAARPPFLRDLRGMNQVLVPRGLRLLPLRWEPGWVLLYLYRPAALARDLAARPAQALLRQAGYPAESPPACLRELRRRFAAGGPFPHEVGLFLSYPPEDVAGFCRHRGRGAKCVGCWKVYGDETAARRRFAAYKACTAAYTRQAAAGVPLSALTVPQ